MDWNKVAALGQVAGAIATFTAVVVSLRMAGENRRVSLKISAGRRILLGGSLPQPVHLINIAIVNTGMRMVHINSFGWRTGWGARWLPASMRFQYATQMTVRAGQHRLPFNLQLGEDGSIRVDEAGLSERIDDGFFTRKPPWPLSRMKTPIYAMVSTSVDTKFQKVEPALALFLRGAPRPMPDLSASLTDTPARTAPPPLPE